MTLSTAHGPLLHFVLELAAYFVGFRYFIYLRRRAPGLALAGLDQLWVAAGAICGAALGSKLMLWLQYPDFIWTHRGDWSVVLGGKTIVGGLLGGLIGVELVKRARGIAQSTGDLFVLPLIAGMMIGRLGCFFAGLEDNTYGNPTNLPWAVTYDNDVPRHPAPLYEMAFLGFILFLLLKLRPRLIVPGDLFRLFLAAYLAFRFAIDFIKPPHFPARTAAEAAIAPGYLYFGVLTGIQLACLAGLLYYLPSLLRIARQTWWRR